VRAAVNVDPVTAQVTAVTDPIPTILQGVPLRLRSMQIRLDRQGFSRNPTNCRQKSIAARIAGDQGSTAVLSSPYQASNCADLAFAPKLSLKLTGGIKRRGHPAIHAFLQAHPGEANIQRVSVALPKNELLDNAHIGTVCNRVAFANEQCPAGSLLGTGEATSPLLGYRLKGNVYLRSNPAHKLPDLVVALRGKIDIDLAAKIDQPKGSGLRTTFESVPDVPVSSFALDLEGGGKGLLINSAGLCTGIGPAVVKMTAQNNRVANKKLALDGACGKAGRHKRAAKTKDRGSR
jgi:hypothetical protein